MSSSAEAPLTEGHVGPNLPQARLWTVNDPVQCPLPAPHSDPWKLALDKTRGYDKERCDAWKDEVDKVLLFASLFSAIVAAFALDSSKKLEVDHQESASIILLAIHQQLDSMARQNTTTLPSILHDPSSSFAAPPYAVHVNICWYLSLIVSLTTVVVGISCLQWLREHTRDFNGPTDNVLFVRIFRIQALTRWWVPAFIASLPVLLLASLFLFLSGLVIALWNLNRTVAVAASTAIGAIVIFLIATSILPAMHDQCAFRSPQAWVVGQLWRILRFIGMLVLTIVAAVPLALFFLCVHLSVLVCRTTGNHSWGDTVGQVFLQLGFDFAKALPDQHTSLSSKADKDWIVIDGWTVEQDSCRPNPRFFQWEWFATSLSPDSEAMLAFLQCVNMTRFTAKHMRDRSLLARQMTSLLGRHRYTWVESWRALPLDNQTDYTNVLSPNGFSLAMPLCIRYAVNKQPLLLPRFFHYLLDCHVRLVNSESPQQLGNPIVQRLMDDFIDNIKSHVWPAVLEGPSSPDIRSMITELPEAYRQQNREALFRYLTGGRASHASVVRRLMAMLHLDKDFEPRDRWSTPESVKFINRQLARALTTSSTPEEAAMLAENLAEYLCFWLELRITAGLVDFGGTVPGGYEAQVNAYFNQSGHCFVLLACAINGELSKPRNHKLREKVSHSGKQWCWTDLARDVFGLEPIQFHDGLVGATANTAHITLSVLPTHPGQPHDDAFTPSD